MNPPHVVTKTRGFSGIVSGARGISLATGPCAWQCGGAIISRRSAWHRRGPH
uniref:Uncharacterized protein n=1 Tax=Zea mays TaxID=4577 RepID=B6TT81_MAIZE|nr:hypothetical protein [Zea mays]ACG46035.1 hypothetical protein [Zea mays]